MTSMANSARQICRISLMKIYSKVHTFAEFGQILPHDGGLKCSVGFIIVFICFLHYFYDLLRNVCGKVRLGSCLDCSAIFSLSLCIVTIKC